MYSFLFVVVSCLLTSIYFFPFFFGHPMAYVVLGQGSDPSYSCDLNYTVATLDP